MKKNVFGRRFKRDTNERKALFKSLLSALMINERIETTEEKARSIRGIAEKLITRAKKKNSRDSLFKRYLVQEAIDKLTKKISPLFAKTQGGYTRTIKTGNRLSDNAAMAIIEFTKKTVNSAEEITITEKLNPPAVIEAKIKDTKQAEKKVKRSVKKSAAKENK